METAEKKQHKLTALHKHSSWRLRDEKLMMVVAGGATTHGQSSVFPSKWLSYQLSVFWTGNLLREYPK
jgi:hypothetical protein